MSCTHPNYTHEARSQARVQTQPPCWGEPRKFRNLTEFISGWRKKKPTNRAGIGPVYASSLSHIHLWFPSLPSVKPVWHLPAASSALRLTRSCLAHNRRASPPKRSYCKYDNSIRCCNQFCQWVTRARAPTQKYLRSVLFIFLILVKRSETVHSFKVCTFAHLSDFHADFRRDYL